MMHKEMKYHHKNRETNHTFLIGVMFESKIWNPKESVN